MSPFCPQFRLKDVKTAKGRRTIVLSAPTVQRLRQHRERMLAERRDVEHGLVFPSRAGTFIGKSNLLRYVFQPMIERAGVPTIGPYDLRHTSATLLLQAGTNIKVVSERLGHASIEITLTHSIHTLPGQQEIAASCFGRVFGSVNGSRMASCNNGSEKGCNQKWLY